MAMIFFLLCFTLFKAGIKWRKKAKELIKPIMTFGVVCLLISEVVGAFHQPLFITTFDVGHGDATLIRYHHRTILVDTGSAYAHLDEILQAQGIHTIDYLILSHSHEDHIGGFLALQKKMPIKRIICLSDTKDVLLSNGAKNFETEIPERLHIDDLIISLGVNYSERDPNDHGIWVWLNQGDFNGVLLGDYSKETISKLEMPRQVTWLKVAHHGSNTSLPDEFLKKHTVATAVISHQLKYHMPSQTVVDQFIASGSEVETTFMNGQMTWQIYKDKITYKNYFSKWF